MLGYNQIRWEKDKLYRGKEFTKVWMEESKLYPKMYHVAWDLDTADKTKQCFNKMNARDNGKVLYLRYVNGRCEIASQEPADAFK